MQAEADETIPALRQGVILPYGCKDGTQACKGKVVSGTVDHGRSQPHALSAGQGRRPHLFRCATAHSDLVIECKQARSAKELPIKTLPARIEEFANRLDVAILKLRLPASETLDFHAGQYIDILLQDGKKLQLLPGHRPPGRRPAGVAHPPRARRACSTDQVFSTMKARTSCVLNGPLGSFYLRDESTRSSARAESAPHQVHRRASHCPGLPAPHAHLLGPRPRPTSPPELAGNGRRPPPHHLCPGTEPAADDAWDGRTGLSTK